MIGQLLGQRHGQLSWPGYRAVPTCRMQVMNANLIVLRHVFWMLSKVMSLSCRDNRSRKASLANSSVMGLPVNVHCDDAPQGTFQFANVRADPLGHEHRDLGRHLHVGLARFAHQDRGTRLQLGWFTATVRPQPKRDLSRSSRR